MKITEIESLRKQQGRRMMSFEIFPPKGDLTVDSLRETVASLKALSPDYISVTYSAGGSGNSGKTAALSSMIKKDYGVESMAHLTCINSSVEDIKSQLSEFKAEGIDNVLALRGDLVEGSVQGELVYATDLIPHIKDAGFCVSAACYPEGHVASASPERDIYYMRRKEALGVEHFISQLFFSNSSFYTFINRIRQVGVKASVSAGIMPILSKSQVTRMIFTCGASLPAEIVRILYKYENDPDSLRKAGIEYAAEQICGLLENTDCPIHIYAMNRPDIATSIIDIIKESGLDF
jgi:methylenetetrahydrofolate reductase (NADPH)